MRANENNDDDDLSLATFFLHHSRRNWIMNRNLLNGEIYVMCMIWKKRKNKGKAKAKPSTERKKRKNKKDVAHLERNEKKCGGWKQKLYKKWQGINVNGSV